MEGRAKALGRGGKLKYACPGNCGNNAIINASFAGSPPLGAQVYLDIHDGATGSLNAATNVVDAFKQAGSKARVVVWETNTARHDFSRVVDEGADLNDLQRAGWKDDARVDSRVESFCMEKSAHDPCLDAQNGFCGDQGAIFFTENATWAQPPFYVHQMILDSPGQDLLLDAQVSGGPSQRQPLNVLAAKSHAGDTVVLRVVNSGAAAVNITVRFSAGDASRTPSSFAVQRLAAPGGVVTTDNPVWDPARHSPVAVPAAPFEPAAPLAVPPVSFSIYTFAMGGAGE